MVGRLGVNLQVATLQVLVKALPCERVWLPISFLTSADVCEVHMLTLRVLAEGGQLCPCFCGQRTLTDRLLPGCFGDKSRRRRLLATAPTPSRSFDGAALPLPRQLVPNFRLVALQLSSLVLR